MTFELVERQDFFRQCQQQEDAKEWKKLMEDLPEPVIFVKNKEITFSNKATLELLDIKYPIQDYKWLIDEFDWLLHKFSKKSLKSYIESDEEKFDHVSLFTGKKNDQKKWLNIKCIRNENITEYIFQDISAMKKLERDRAKAECYDILLATSSHDIRTPLNMILGTIDVLHDNELEWRCAELSSWRMYGGPLNGCGDP